MSLTTRILPPLTITSLIRSRSAQGHRPAIQARRPVAHGAQGGHGAKRIHDNLLCPVERPKHDNLLLRLGDHSRLSGWSCQGRASRADTNHHAWVATQTRLVIGLVARAYRRDGLLHGPHLQRAGVLGIV
jgi:hypothetical protein